MKKIGNEAKALDPDHDFYFVVLRHMVVDFSLGQLHALCCHELKHIGPRDIDNEGNETVKIVKHDFEEFYSILGAFGPDWTFNPKCVDPSSRKSRSPTCRCEKLSKKNSSRRPPRKLDHGSRRGLSRSAKNEEK